MPNYLAHSTPELEALHAANESITIKPQNWDLRSACIRTSQPLSLARPRPPASTVHARPQQHSSATAPSLQVGTFEWKLKRRRKSRSRKQDGYVYKSDTILDSFFGKSGPITDVKVEKSSVHLIKPQETRRQADKLAIPQRLMPHR